MAERDPVDSLDYRVDSPPKGKAKQVMSIMIPVSWIVRLIKYIREKV